MWGVEMVLHESAEDYLEAILRLSERRGYARSVDVANELGVTKPSVSVAMKKLHESGYISFDENGFLLMTESGREVAEKTYSKHLLLTGVLEAIGVDHDTADREACKIEHDISDRTYELLSTYYNEHMKETG